MTVEILEDSSIYQDLSKERRKLQSEGSLPEWMTTNAWGMFKQKYLFGVDTYKEQIQRIASTLSSHTDEPEKWNDIFFNMIWNGWLSPSTPVLANTGTDRGMPVSCSGSTIPDSIEGFFDSYKETAVFSKNGFGTSVYCSGIRPRGSVINGAKGTAEGSIPVIEMIRNTVRQVSQGSSRRGACASYLNIQHDDMWELCDLMKNVPDDLNIGWCVGQDFIDNLDAGDKDSIARYQRSLKTKVLTGKGYYYFIDKVNNLAPAPIKNCGFPILAGNLCAETAIPSNDDYSFTCVLSSLNLSRYHEWKDTDTIFNSTVFLDCVASEFIASAKRNNVNLPKAIKFTEDFRALGLGVLGYHTLMQDNMISFGSMDAHYLTAEIFKKIDEESLRASQWMAKKWGEPKFCKGYGVRNATRIAIAPTMSTALLCGSVSQGIEPVYKNVYMQDSAAGAMKRINPSLLKLLKIKGKYTDKVINSIIDNKGSVSHLDFLSEEEKNVFKTAFEIDQMVIIRLASLRQRYIDQAQSLNLFFDADESERYISEVHKAAFKDPYIKSLYYLRSEAGVSAAKSVCESCEG